MRTNSEQECQQSCPEIAKKGQSIILRALTELPLVIVRSIGPGPGREFEPHGRGLHACPISRCCC
jgi:hypothetical protein